MNKKQIVIHGVVPIIVAIIAGFICLKVFYVPDPQKVVTASWITYAVAVGVSLFALVVSTLISIITYICRKRK